MKKSRVRVLVSMMLMLVICFMSSVPAFASYCFYGKDWEPGFRTLPEASTSIGNYFNPHVMVIQKFCQCYDSSLWNYIVYNGGVDGYYGNATKNAVISFQNSKGLNPDGAVGEYTWTQILYCMNISKSGTSPVKYHFYCNSMANRVLYVEKTNGDPYYYYCYINQAGTEQGSFRITTA